LQCSPSPLAVFRGPTSKGGGGRERGGEGEEKGKGAEGKGFARPMSNCFLHACVIRNFV